MYLGEGPKNVLGKDLMAQMAKNLPARHETQVRSLDWSNPLEEGMATHSSILALRIPWTPGEENGNPLQYSCLENSLDRGTWRAAVHGVAKSWTALENFDYVI